MTSFGDTEATLQALYQCRIYEGLLEGLPTRGSNDVTLERYLSLAEDLFEGRPCGVLEPKRTPIEHVGDYPFGTPEALPPVVCIGRFTAEGGDATRFSELVLVWFQDDFSPAICDEVAEELALVNWSSLAVWRDK